MKGLTERQRETLAWIVAYIQSNWRPPTAEEIAVQFQIARPSAFDMIRALQKKGFLERGDGTPRSLKPRSLAAASAACIDDRLWKLAPASGAISEVRGFEGFVRVAGVHGGSQALFAVVVRGDGMIEVGIMDGDLAVIRQQEDVEDGDVVLASYGNEVTLRRVSFGEKGTLLFTPDNRAYDVVAVPADAVTIYGKVVAVHRDME